MYSLSDNSAQLTLSDILGYKNPGRSFPRYSSSPGRNSSKIFDNSFVYLFPAWNFPVFFSPFGQSSLIYINYVWLNYIYILSITIGPSQKHQFVYLYSTCVLCQLWKDSRKKGLLYIGHQTFLILPFALGLTIAKLKNYF